MMEYCLGYCFNDAKDMFLGILKTKPASMRGKINGIGGKAELIDLECNKFGFEDPLAAMNREFYEETGYPNLVDWQLGIQVHSPADLGCPTPFIMNVFFAVDQGPHDFIIREDYSNPTEEPVFLCKMGIDYGYPYMNNVKWHTEFFHYILTRPDDQPKLPVIIDYYK